MFEDLAILRGGAEALGVTLGDEQLAQFRRYGESLLATPMRLGCCSLWGPTE